MGQWLKENWFKLLIGGSLVVITFFCYFRSLSLRNFKETPSVSKAFLNGKSAKEDLEMQDLCSKRAEEYFNKTYSPVSEKGTYTSYTAHYNRRSNQCFILAETNIMTSGYRIIELVDVFEKKMYGQYEIDKGDLYPYSCWVLNQNKSCTSTIWDFREKDVKSYMEE